MITIAFQGERGAYSEQAILGALNQYNHQNDVNVLPCGSFSAITHAVETGQADYAMLPLENSSAGSVLPAYDALLGCSLCIVGEYYQAVHHCLLGNPGSELTAIKTAFSHPQALAQSAEFLKSHGIAPDVFVDTAGSAKALAQTPNLEKAAIASALCAKIYGLKILAKNIEDLTDNQTRFVLLSKKKKPFIANKDIRKTSLIFSLKNESGQLHDILSLFAKEQMNLSKIESRPDRKSPFCYQFILDFEHADSAQTKETLLKVQNKVSHYRWLGTY